MPNYAFEGPTWSSSIITWGFAASGGSFTGAISGAYQDIVQAALTRWAQVANITFQQVSDNANPNIRIGWGQFSGGQVGETNYSYSLGAAQNFISGVTVRLEDPSARPLSAASGSFYQGTATTLFQVALHEIGHALGLAHSTDVGSIMYPSIGPSDPNLSASDIQGIQTLYGASLAPAVTTVAQTAIVPAITLTGSAIAVYRFFDASNGTQFLTANLSERNTVLSTRPDLAYEGLAMGAVSSPAGDARAVPVYRFFDTRNGSHFFTTSQAENAQVLASRPDLVSEPVTFYEHATPSSGDVPVYRYFDASTGTHFFTSSPSESAALQATRPDMSLEGIAFYAPSAGSANAMIGAANGAAAPDPVTVSINDDTVLLYRLDNMSGRQLLTADRSEVANVIATDPSFRYTGATMGAVSPDAGDATAVPVFRFFNAATGDHFLTANAAEAAKLAQTRPDLVAEQSTFDEHLTQQPGDAAVYRFFDNTSGTHFYTANQAERASILATRPDMAQEGIAFYAPSIG